MLCAWHAVRSLAISGHGDAKAHPFIPPTIPHAPAGVAVPAAVRSPAARWVRAIEALLEAPMAITTFIPSMYTYLLSTHC